MAGRTLLFGIGGVVASAAAGFTVDASSAPDPPAPVASVEALRRALATAKPGERILVAAGEYAGFHASDVQGTATQPIVLRAADPLHPPRFTGSVHLSDVVHFNLEHIEIIGAAGNGLNIDDGGSIESPSHHVALRQVTVRACGGTGNDDGIKLSGLDDFTVEGCTVETWGRGGSAIDMVGCHRGVIDGCTIRDRAVETASSGVQAKGGSREVAIRSTRFEHAGQRAVNIGGSTGLGYFRPKPEGFEAKDITVEGCTFIGSLAPIAFVGVDGAVVRQNTFYRPAKWLLRILQETREPGFVACRNGVFRENLVVYHLGEVGTAVNVGPGTAPETFRFERNYWFAIDAPARSVPKLPQAESGSMGGADPRFRDAAAGDFRLDDQSPARGFGAEAFDARPAGERGPGGKG